MLQCVNLIICMVCFVLMGTVEGRGNQYVTCGSVIKLLNVGYKVRLHSHDVKYGTGSGQQSVTGISIQEDVNSYWEVKAETKKHCNRGEPIKCREVIRLQHLGTSKNLHSHYFSSPLTANQEISAYGDDRGEGDTGDHWMVVCSGEYWDREQPVMLKHVDTDAYLSATGRSYGHPINGQVEIAGISSSSSNNVQWQVKEGVFIHPSEFNTHHVHTEL
ncbi:stromal cell-derived factor 2 [Bacillus rossius redtenbacheri]|uniref:stromal cell-derived factor 2 n=1 Tax=Bacillus rossius redtenbacheri TaxID=93214 RepID=UPI002FDD0F2D